MGSSVSDPKCRERGCSDGGRGRGRGGEGEGRGRGGGRGGEGRGGEGRGGEGEVSADQRGGELLKIKINFVPRNSMNVHEIKARGYQFL